MGSSENSDDVTLLFTLFHGIASKTAQAGTITDRLTSNTLNPILLIAERQPLPLYGDEPSIPARAAARRCLPKPEALLPFSPPTTRRPFHLRISRSPQPVLPPRHVDLYETPAPLSAGTALASFLNISSPALWRGPNS